MATLYSTLACLLKQGLDGVFTSGTAPHQAQANSISIISNHAIIDIARPSPSSGLNAAPTLQI